MACCPSQPAPSMAASEPDLSVDGTVNSHPPQLDILAQDKRQDVPGEEPVAEIDSGGRQDLSLRKSFLNLPSTTLQSGQDAKEESQVRRGNVRAFLPSSFKEHRFLSPILDLSPLSPLSGVEVHGKPNHEICASVMDEMWGKCGDAMDISMLEMESLPYSSWLDFTMESSCLQEFGSPDLEGRVKVNGGAEESSKKLEAEGAKESVQGQSASLCFNTRKGLVPLSMEKVPLLNISGNVSVSSTSVLNCTTDLSPCEGSVRIQGLHEVKAGNITEAVPVGDPITNEVSSTQASANVTHVLHSGMSVNKSNLTAEFTEKCTVGPTAGGICISGETEATPNLTVEIMDHGNARSLLEDSAKSLELKNGTFDVPTPECECVCDAKGGAEGQLASLTKVENCDGAYTQGLDVEDDGGASMWSMKANSLVTSAPLVVPKSFSFTKAAPSDVCKRLSVVDHSDVSDGDSVGNNPSAFPQVDQPPPAGAKPPAKSLTRSTGLPLKCGGKAQPSNKKLLPNPKPLPTIPRPSSSHLSLAPPPKTTAGPQALGAASLLSSTQTRFRRQTGGTLRNLAASGSREASLGFTTGHRHSLVSENKPPVSGLHKPRTRSQLPPSSSSSRLCVRPTGQAASKLQTVRPAATSRPLGVGDPKGKSPQSSTSSLKQPLRSAERTLPPSKKKKVAPPRAVSRPRDDELGGAEAQGPDCEDCEKYRREITRLQADCEKYRQEKARLHAELQEQKRSHL